MNERYFYLRLGVLVVLSMFATISWLPSIASTGNYGNILTVKFLDVGQGDAIQVITPDGFELLVDGGPTASVLRELAKDRRFFDKEIDVVVATHPDTDHIGGLVDVFKRYDVGLILETEAVNDSPASRSYEQVVTLEGAKVVVAEAGQVIQLGASTTIKILSPHGDTSEWKSNNASIAVQIIYGEVEFLLTGDAPSEIEDYLVGVFGADLESDVLKLGHHGSKTSTSELFLDTVKPEYAVVSASIDNRYGHPHFSVMDRVFERNIEALSTATDGTIVFKSDGKDVWVE